MNLQVGGCHLANERFHFGYESKHLLELLLLTQTGVFASLPFLVVDARAVAVKNVNVKHRHLLYIKEILNNIFQP